MSTKPTLSRLTMACALALVAAGPCAQSATAGDMEDYEAAYQRVKAALTKHDDEGARLAYLDAIAKLDALGRATDHGSDGIEAAVYMELAAFDEKRGRTQDAANEFQSAVQFADSSGRSTSVAVALFSSQRLAALYFRNGDYHQARDAAQGALLHLEAGEFPPGRTAEEKLKAQLVIAKCDAGQGLPQLAKGEFDELWKLAEGMHYIEPETASDLLESSTRLYRQLHLDQLADATVQHAQVLEQKRQAEASYTVKAPPSVSTHPPAQQKPLPQPAQAPENPQGDTKPAFIDLGGQTCPPPNYPHDARTSGAQGTVKVLFKISREGKMTDAALIQSSGNTQLDDQTLKGFVNCHFKPATHDGQAVDGEFNAVYVWKLE